MAYSEGKMLNELGNEITMKLGSCEIRGHAGVLIEVIGPDSHMENALTLREFENLVSMGVAFQTKK